MEKYFQLWLFAGAVFLVSEEIRQESLPGMSSAVGALSQILWASSNASGNGNKWNLLTWWFVSFRWQYFFGHMGHSCLLLSGLKLSCLTEISMFHKYFVFLVDQNFDFCPKFRFLRPKIQIFLTKISICDQHFDLWLKFRFVIKISIFDQNLDFVTHISTFYKLSHHMVKYFQLWLFSEFLVSEEIPLEPSSGMSSTVDTPSEIFWANWKASGNDNKWTTLTCRFMSCRWEYFLGHNGHSC